MSIHSIRKVLLLTSLLFCCTLPTNASLWPGLGTQAKEKSGAFRTDDYQVETTLLQSPWLIAHGNNMEYAGKVNAAIAREKNKFIALLEEKNSQRKTWGRLGWHEGMVGNFITNKQGLTSIVLIEQTLSAGESHGTTFAKGLTFNGNGDILDLSDILPQLTVEDVNHCIKLTAEKKQISLLPKHTVTELPTNFYIGKNGVVYVLYQQNDLTPSEEGVFSVPIGNV